MKLFYLLLANNFMATLTNLTVWFALIFFIYLQTHSVFATSMIAGIHLVLTAASGIWFGSLVDHHRKKSVMIASSLFSLVAYALGFLIFITNPIKVFSSIHYPMIWLFILVLLMGIIAGNIRGITLPTLVTSFCPKEKRDKANGLVGTVSGIGFLVTSVISGFLVGKTSMYGVFIMAISLTVGVIIHLIWLNVPEKKLIHTTQAERIDLKGTMKVIRAVPGLLALILFATINNFLGGVFMSLMDAYGLSLVSVEIWGLLWGFLSIAFIIGGLLITKWGLGKQPLASLMRANMVIWIICSLFTVYPSIVILAVCSFIYLMVIPYIEAAEQTIFQNVVPPERQGRVFGFAQTVEQMASPITAFTIGPIAEFIIIPFMTNGWGAQTIGPWFGTGSSRGIALVFTLTGIIGLIVTLMAWKSKFYTQLSAHYLENSR